MKRERREERSAHDRLAYGRHRRRVLVAQQVAAQSGLGALSVLEFDDGRTLNGLLADAEQAGGDLSNDVVFVRNQPVEIPTFAGTSEGVPSLGIPCPAQQHVRTGRPERHSATVPRHVDGDFGAVVVPAVKQHFGRDVLATKIAGRGFGKSESQTIESAAGGTQLALQMRPWRMACLSHLPGGGDQVGRPSVVADCLEGWVFRQRKRLVRAGVNAVLVRLRAVGPDAPVIERPHHLPVAFGAFVDPIFTRFDTAATLLAVRGSVDAVFADLVAISRRGEADLARNLGVIRSRNEVFDRLWNRFGSDGLNATHDISSLGDLFLV